jgi:hypothetical protein
MLALFLLAMAVAFGQSVEVVKAVKPNFSGTWRLNVQRSGPILPRGLESLVIIIDHRDPVIRSNETRTVAGKVTKGGSEARIDGLEHVDNSKPGKTVKQKQSWSGDILLMHWELTENGTTYVSDIRQKLSDDRKVLTMSEHYREPGMERIRDWVFEKQ